MFTQPKGREKLKRKVSYEKYTLYRWQKNTILIALNALLNFALLRVNSKSKRTFK